jgi:hypothetical protein
VILAVLVVGAVVAVLVVHHADHSTKQTDPVRQLVVTELDAGAGNASAACQSLHSYTSDRVALQHLLDSVPPVLQASFVASLKSAAASWLPRAAASWNFAQVRDALLFLWDECGRRNLGG